MSPLESGYAAAAGSTPQADFSTRHIGLNAHDISHMLAELKLPSVDALMDEVVPANIRRADEMQIGAPLSEAEILAEMKEIAGKNRIVTSLICMGYYGCNTPPVILRNVLENPAWYTAYTPYQPEISQGRLEAILNFQTMIMELTGMDIANGSLLDEATAAAEGMAMAYRAHRGKGTLFRVDPDTHPQTLAVLRTRAAPIGIEIEVRDPGEAYDEGCFGALISYPGSSGEVRDIKPEIDAVKAAGGLAIVATDLLALTMIDHPGHLAPIWFWAPRSVLVFPSDMAARMPLSLPAARRISARSPAGWSVSARTARAAWPIVLPCRHASSISAARKPPPTSAQHRCCWR